ncbi:MAG TPA: SpoIIE family protein phosphatase [Candidatus Ozemobacteraceae bacterium]|nr:SpoIIE family protein phosphatase [Candidatus Ozemobacteraceae bacterium]
MRGRIILVFLLGLTVIGGIGRYVFRDQASQTQIQAAEELRERAFELSAEAHPNELARRLLQRLLSRTHGRPVRETVMHAAFRRLIRGLPADGFTLFLVDRDEEVLWSSRPDRSLWRIIKQRLGTTWLRDYGLPVPTWRHVRPTKRPGTLACWMTGPETASGTVAGAVLAIDTQRITRGDILEWAVRQRRKPGEAGLGLWDRVARRAVALPAGIGAAAVDPLLARHLRRENSWIASQGRLLVLHPVDDSRVLVGCVDEARVVIHPLVWLVVALWGLACLSAWRVGESGNISLKAFLGVALGVAAGLPLFLTLMFWSFFEKSRVDSLVAAELKAMEQRLIQVDNAVPVSKRQRRRLLRTLAGRLDGAPPASFPEVMTDAGLVELSNEAYDAFFLVGSDGAHLRDWGMLIPSLRHVAKRPMAEKLTRLPGMLGINEMPSRSMIELTLKLRPTIDHLPALWSCKRSADHTRRTRDGIGVLGKMIIDRYNQTHGLGGKPGSGGKSDLVYGAVIDAQTGDLVQAVFSNLGDIFRLGSGILSCWSFFDVIRDASGVGQYFAFFFTDLRGVEHGYLEEFFANRRRQPSDWYFAAESQVSQVFYPVHEKAHPLRRHFDRVAPPRVLFSKVVSRQGRKVLLAAYAARNMNHFVLFARRPWSVIEAGRAALLRQMGVIAVMMFVLMLGVFWRMYQGIVAPAGALMEGVKALEEKRFTHSIPSMTGDEWDELAASFNTAIQGMEELQVAGSVQAMILPSGPVRGKAGDYLGQSLMSGHVGGDYFDALVDEAGDINFVIGDVTGHGVSAALVVAMVKSSFSILHRSGVRSPAELLTNINGHMLSHLAKKKGLSMAAGRLTADGRLLYSNAGQPYPYLLSPDAGMITRLAYPGVPLGILKKSAYNDVEIPVTPGAILVLVSDGIIEQPNEAGEPFGFERLHAALESRINKPSESLLTELFEELRRYSGPIPWKDDVTLACLRITTPNPTEGIR